MQYIKFTYVDSITGISISKQPATNGPVFPAVAGLEYVWARESRYPTDVPEFFGTCPDDADTQVDGVLGAYVQQDWETMQADEMAARDVAPTECTRRQGRLALLQNGLLDEVEAVIAGIADPVKKRAAQIEYEADTWSRENPFLQQMCEEIGQPPEKLLELFKLAVTL